jgi:DNA-binding NarL/FixJ family response regulator
MANFQLLSIGNDPIFRLGLRIACQDYPDLQVFAEVSTVTEALEVLEVRSVSGEGKPADLVVFDFDGYNVRSGEMSGPAFCQQLKSLYPNLPVLLLGGSLTPEWRSTLQETNVNGYCPKGRDIALTIAAIHLVASGQTYWLENVAVTSEIELDLGVVQAVKNSPVGVDNNADFPIVSTPIHRKLLADICLSGLWQIDANLAVVKAELQETIAAGKEDFASVLDGVLLSGHRRELLAARWIVSQLLPGEGRRKKEEGRRKREEGRGKKEEGRMPFDSGQGPRRTLTGVEWLRVKRGKKVLNHSELVVENIESLVIASDWQGSLFDSVTAKLQFDLVNLTGVPLEIDILRSTKKLELISSILRKLEELLEELRFSQVQQAQLPDKMPAILRDLWEVTIIDFFGRYYTLQVTENPVFDRIQTDLKLSKSLGESSASVFPRNDREVVPVLLEDANLVGAEILDKIPMSVDLFAHLLFENPLIVDNISCLAGSPQAMQRAESLLENLAIQVASGVVQPLLNNFADVEEIKQSFYDGKLISTREIERFRNNLSWKYRWKSYFVEPKAIFESRFWLFVLRDSGIQRISIYAPRNLELAELSGWPLALTLVLEARDAIAPRVRAVILLLGAGIVYVLTQVIGRGIGLVGRGIIQGIGNSLQDTKFGKNG